MGRESSNSRSRLLYEAMIIVIDLDLQALGPIKILGANVQATHAIPPLLSSIFFSLEYTPNPVQS